MRESRTSTRTVIACGVIAVAIALVFAYRKSQSELHSTVSIPGAEAPGSLRAWSRGAPSNTSTVQIDKAARAVETTLATLPPGPAAADLSSVKPSLSEIGSANLPPPDLGPEFIPEPLQAMIRRHDQGTLQARGIKSQLEYWSERKNELDREAPDHWSREMESRLREYFESLPQAPAIRVEIACRTSQCLLRIVDTLAATEWDSYRVGGMTFHPDSPGISAIMWRLMWKPWFKSNLFLGNNNYLHLGFDPPNELWLFRLTRARRQQ